MTTIPEADVEEAALRLAGGHRLAGSEPFEDKKKRLVAQLRLIQDRQTNDDSTRLHKCT